MELTIGAGGSERRVSVYLIRLTFVGELGYELHLNKEDALHVYEHLHATAECHTIQPFMDSGYKAIDSLCVFALFACFIHADGFASYVLLFGVQVCREGVPTLAR